MSLVSALRARLAAERGANAERAAETLLRRHGLSTLDRNWRAKTGELDLVMLDVDTLVVVEVRARTHSGWGAAIGSVDRRKQLRIARTAQLWIQQHPQWQSAPMRFDVVNFEAGHAPEWLPAAFSLDEAW